jgi:tungstate transport system substrate-binding protein
MVVNLEKFPSVKSELATNLVQWMISVDTQKLIANYGIDKFGSPLFYPNAK